MKDVMIDFETFSTGENACICQVGAVYFDPITGDLGKTFSANIDAGSHVAAGAKMDASTVYWWLSQSKEAQNSLLTDRAPIINVMYALNDFLENATRVWSHATFDFVILMNTFKQLNLTPKISYKAGMDLRTLVYLSGLSMSDFPREGVHHNGLDDAKHQVKYCVAALNAVKANKKALAFLERQLK